MSERIHPKNPGFHERLVELMTKRSVSGGELGRRIDMRRGSVSKLTSGKAQPTIETFARIVTALDLGPKEAFWLLGLERIDGKFQRAA